MTYIVVTDLKNYVYCPYIVYLKRVVGIEERVTEYMMYGREVELEKIIAFLYSRFRARTILRRTQLVSKKLKLVGIVDIIVVDKYGRYIPVDLKWSNVPEGVRLDHKVQLCAYALLIEENFNTVVKEGYILYNLQEGGELRRVVLTSSLRKYTLQVLQNVREIVEKGQIPQHHKVDREKCRTCEYRKQCVFRQY